MNAKAAKGAKGCAGAVWADGSLSRDYCTNTGYAKGRFPWWGKCCKVFTHGFPMKTECVSKDRYE